jgi:hypothetical protein
MIITSGRIICQTWGMLMLPAMMMAGTIIIGVAWA